MKFKFSRRSIRPLFVFVLVCTLWATRMSLVQAYYERTLKLGYYPPNADSIAIPLASETLVTIVIFPFLAFFLFRILTPFPRQCSWLAWNRNQWQKSAFWTLLCGLLIFQTVPFLLENWRIGLWLNGLSNIAWILIWIELRAVIVSKLRPTA